MATTGLRTMQKRDLDLVRGWRNHAEVRRHMFTSREFSAEEHAAWFETANRDPRRRLMLFEREGRPCGFVQFGPFERDGASPWGFYLAPDAPAGSGRLLGEAALDFAFDQLAVHKISGEALADNERSIRFHLRLGFREEGRFLEQHFDGRQHRDVVRFGLLADDWRKRMRRDV